MSNHIHPVPCIHPIECIVPPHMLEKLATEGTDAQKEKALRTMTVSEQFRGLRVAAKDFAPLAAGVEAVGKHRIVYDAKEGSSLPGTPARNEGDPPTGDDGVDEAYDGSGATYDLYKDVYGRDSINGKGLRLDSTVHFRKGYDNAFWNGKQMVYGDGDEDLPEADRLFNRFTIAIDIIAHELTHGVTQYEAALVYRDQPGALNESFSDVFGALVKQRSLNQQANQADWLIGQGLFTANVKGVAIRSMKAPGTAYNDPVLGKDPQPGHMDDYLDTPNDNGGVHINSGIPNRAFFVVATELGGFAWEKAGKIWYVTLRDKLQPKSNFQTAANETYLVAADLFGDGSLEQQAVKKGWAAVGINVGGGPLPPDNGDDDDGCLKRIFPFLKRAE